MKETHEQKLEKLEIEIDKICEKLKSNFQELVFRTMSHREIYMEKVKKDLEESYEQIKKKD